MAKKLLLVDFDGTLAKYEPTQLFTDLGEPLPHARKAMILLSRTFHLVCFTTRPSELVESWLRRWGFPTMDVTNIKKPGVIIDDRAITFKGQWTDELLNQIKIFEPHWSHLPTK